MTRIARRWTALPGRVRTRVRVAAAVVVVLVGLALLFRLPLSLAAVLGLSVVTLAAVVGGGHEDAAPGWPEPREEPYRRGWQSLSLLAHDIAVADSSPREFDAVVAPRLRRLAETVLTRRGVDWDSDAARTRGGAELHTALTGAPGAGGQGAGGPRAVLVRATLDAVDRLHAEEPGHAGAHADGRAGADADRRAGGHADSGGGSGNGGSGDGDGGGADSADIRRADPGGLSTGAAAGRPHRVRDDRAGPPDADRASSGQAAVGDPALTRRTR